MKEIDVSAAVWKKSRYSNGQANCVEVATNLPGMVAVRDSKDPDGSVLFFTAEAWRVFVGTVREGDRGS